MKLSASSLSIAMLFASRLALAAEDPSLTAAELFGPPEPDRVVEEPKPKAPSAVTWQLESGAASTYVWRGRPQYASRNDPSMQSSANMTWSGLGPGALTLGGWNAMALDHAGNQPGTASRVDLSIGYGWALNRRLKARVGYTAILFPHAKTKQTVDGAHELVSMLTYDGVVTPFVAVYPEVVRMLGVYATTGVSKTIELPDGYSLTPVVELAAAGYQGSPMHFQDVDAALVATRTFANGIYVSGRGHWTLMGGPASQLPAGDDSLRARSVPWGVLAMGVRL